MITKMTRTTSNSLVWLLGMAYMVGSCCALATSKQMSEPVSPRSEMVNVKDFGAVGNGKADDTQAVQTAIDSINPAGGVVYLPVGIYRLTQPIRLKPQLRLMGATHRSWGNKLNSLGSRLLCDHEGHGLYLEYDKNTGGNILIQHLGLQGYNKKEPRDDGVFYKSGHGIYFKNVHDVTLRHVDISNFPENNIHFEGGWHLYIRDCYSAHAGISCFHIDSAHNSLQKAVSDGGQYSLTLGDNSGAADVRGCHFEGATVAGVRVSGSAARLVSNLITVVQKGLIVENRSDGAARMLIIVANHFHGLAGNESVGIDFRNSSCDSMIAENYITVFKVGIRNMSQGAMTINGNMIHASPEGTGIEMNPASDAKPSVVANNVIEADKYSIKHLHGDNITYIGNSGFSSKNKSKPIEVIKGDPNIIR